MKAGRCRSFLLYIFYSAIAQLVEHLICNQAVEGSTPLAGIILTDLDAEVVQW